MTPTTSTSSLSSTKLSTLENQNPGRKNSQMSRINILALGIICALVFVFSIFIGPQTPSVVLSAPPPPIFNTTFEATFCGSDLVPPHLVHSSHASAEGVSSEISKNIRAAGGAIDAIRTKLIAALGKSLSADDSTNDQGLESLPELQSSKITLVESGLMTVNLSQ